MSEFFAMGGYGGYVWFAYGITFLCLVLLLIWSLKSANSRESELDQVRQWARAEKKTPSAVLSKAPTAVASNDDATIDNTSHDHAANVAGAVKRVNE